MPTRPRRDEPLLIEIEHSGGERSDEAGSGDGIDWRVAAVGTLVVLGLAVLGVVGLTQAPEDRLTTPTSVLTSEWLVVDPTEVTAPRQTGWPSTTALLPEEGFAWPGDVAVIVANGDGIHRIAAATGSVGVVEGTSSIDTVPTLMTTLIVDQPVDRAFELEDGSLVYQVTDGDIVRRTRDGSTSTLVPRQPLLVLEDADMPGADPARLRLVYRTASDDPSGAFYLTVRAGDTAVSTLVPGGWGVSYRRFTLWTDNSALASWVDDAGGRGAAVVEFPSGRFQSDQSGMVLLHAAGDPGKPGLVWVTLEGIWTPLDTSPRSLPDLTTVTGVDLRGSSLVMQRGDEVAAELLDLTPYRRYDVPVAGYATVSRFVHSPSAEPPWVSADPGPRMCILGLPGNDSHVAPYPEDLTTEQIAASEVAVVDGFAALIYTMDDGSFVVRITSDACVQHVRAAGIDREQLDNLLTVADVGHVVPTVDATSALDGGTVAGTLP